MKEITSHKTNDCNNAIAICADDPDPNYGNASHVYDVMWQDIEHNSMHVRLAFQCGPILEVGVNGITNEALLAILMDRLEGFQTSQWACEENAIALVHLQLAMQAFEARTAKRLARGVEGTNAV